MSSNKTINSIDQKLKAATTALAEISEFPQSEARSLLASIFEKPTSWIIAWPEHSLSAQQEEQFDASINRRKMGEPLAYILGYKEFWSLKLKVTYDTLIPRADTETLVEFALEHIEETTATPVLDLGTGSGAIALSIASEYPNIRVMATDNSSEALRIAMENRENCCIRNVEFIQSNWFKDIADKDFELIVSNPPYIPRQKQFLEDIELKYEPKVALFSGSTGLSDIRHIISTSRDYLQKNGVLAIEHGCDQSLAIRALFNEYGYQKIATIQDYAHRDRVTHALYN